MIEHYLVQTLTATRSLCRDKSSALVKSFASASAGFSLPTICSKNHTQCVAVLIGKACQEDTAASDLSSSRLNLAAQTGVRRAP